MDKENIFKKTEECYLRKEELYFIYREYEWMFKNIYKHKFFKKFLMQINFLKISK